MTTPLLHKKKAQAISNGVFFVCLGVLMYTGAWWPYILLALWTTLGLRQFLTGRMYDFAFSTVLLLGLFSISVFQIKMAVLIPVLFILGGTYIVFREYFYAEKIVGEELMDEIEEDVELEVEEIKEEVDEQSR